jgi:hypothetical protein
MSYVWGFVMSYKFYVITKTPALLEAGNLSDELGYLWYDSEGVMYTVRGLDLDTSDFHTPLTSESNKYKVPVFEVGEIVICDDSGREVCYPERKPSKWDIEYEVFDNLDDAIKCSQEFI